MKLDFQWPGAIVFAVVFVTLGVLAYVHAVPPECSGPSQRGSFVPSPIQPRASRDAAKKASGLPLLCSESQRSLFVDCKGVAVEAAVSMRGGLLGPFLRFIQVGRYPNGSAELVQ